MCIALINVTGVQSSFYKVKFERHYRMLKNKFVIPALALATTSSFGEDVYRIQMDALESYDLNPSSRIQCTGEQLSWWTGKLKSKINFELNLDLKVAVVTIFDSKDKLVLKKSYKISKWEKDNSGYLKINAKTTDTEQPEVHLAEYDPSQKELELTLNHVNGKHEIVQMNCH